MAATRLDQPFRQVLVRNAKLTGEPLGSGTYSDAVEAVIAEAKCAAKTINERAFSPADTVKMRQANVAAGCVRWSNLRHPNVAQFLGVLERDSPIPALLMEVCVTNLHRFLKSSQTIPLSLTISILQNIASGLAYLHSQVPAVVHGRLSAKKVLLDSGAVAKISVDVGVTVLPQKLDLSPYMPPEVTSKECPRKETIDIFSFGIIAIFTIIKELPDRILPPTYTDESNQLVPRSEVERRANYMEKISRYDRFLNQLITQCLSNQPESRPSLDKILELLRQARIMNPDPYQEKTKAQLVHDMAALSQVHLQMKHEFERHEQGMRDQIQGLLQGMRKQREMLPRNEDEDEEKDVVNESEIAYIVNFLEGIRAKDLGISLGVDVIQLDIIDADHKDKHDESIKRVCVLKEWVTNCVSPTWSCLVEALSTIGQQRMADLISRDKDLQLVTASADSTPSQPEKSEAVVSQTSESVSKKSSTSRTHQLESQLARAKKAQENATKKLDESRKELDEMSERCDSLEEEIALKDKDIKRFQRELKAEELMREEAAKENMELKIQLEKLRASKKKT